MGRVNSSLRRATGMDFSAYRQTTLVRRIQRRMSICQVETLENYAAFLERSTQEVLALAQDLLISVTKFFRDPDAFAVLANQVIPSIVENSGKDKSVRVWVAGCATGEEAYSIAMLFDDYLLRSGKSVDFKIFATDVDRRTLESAGAGIYPRSVLADVPSEFVERYFVSHGEERVQVVRNIRDRLVFAAQNVIKDPPFSRLALVTCRNLLIYLQPTFQKKVLSLMHFSLLPGGYLFLGSSETVGDLQDYFECIDAKWRVYRKSGSLVNRWEPTVVPHVLDRIVPRKDDLPKLSADQAIEKVISYVLDRHLPTTFVVSPKLDVIHSFGPRQPFVELPSGRASLNLLNMVPRDLSLAISTAASAARKTKDIVEYTRVRFVHESEWFEATVKVEALGLLVGSDLLLVTISPTSSDHQAVETEGAEFNREDKTIQRISDLERELDSTRSNLQAAVEEQEAANEELQATNEELLASNEELQSTNEELESVNEELYTVNAELQAKIQELTDTNNDLDNLLRATDIGTIFLDSNLCIRRFTPSITRELNLLPQDIGRPMSDFSYSSLGFNVHDLDRVLHTGQPFERPVAPREGVHYLVRISPYCKSQQGRDGVVVCLVDVSALREAEKKLADSMRLREESQRIQTQIIDALPAHIALVGGDGTILAVNRSWKEFGRRNSLIDPDFCVGKNYLAICRSSTGPCAEEAHDAASGIAEVLAGKAEQFIMEYPCHSQNEKRWFQLACSAFRPNDHIIGAIVMHINITERVLARSITRPLH